MTTFDERVHALEWLGFSEPQTRFLVTVALHSGFCLRRHYAAFTGLTYGQGVRDFLDRLVARRLARRFQFRPDRGHVYHLHHSPIYAAIGQDDNRNRRRTSPALIARKLMLLDYVLEVQAGDWFVTEQDKVELLTTRFGIPAWALPQRLYVGRRGRPWDGTTRYFVQKLPIFLIGQGPLPVLVFLVTDTGGQVFAEFLQDHVPLLSRLPEWRIMAVAPRHIPGLPACRAALHHLTAADRPRPHDEREQLRWYFTVRDRAERNDVANLRMDELGRFHDVRRRFAGLEFEGLFRQWRAEGEAVFEDSGAKAIREALRTGRGGLHEHRLPIRYDRFGTRAGVS